MNKNYEVGLEELTFNQAWDTILEYEIATESEMRLVCNINGRRKSVLDSIVSAKSEYRTIEQYIEFNETHMSWDGERWVEDACLSWDDVLPNGYNPS